MYISGQSKCAGNKVYKTMGRYIQKVYAVPAVKQGSERYNRVGVCVTPPDEGVPTSSLCNSIPYLLRVYSGLKSANRYKI